MFVVIHPDGRTERIPAAATGAAVEAVVGCWDLVRAGRVAGFVSEIGHPAGLPVNVPAGALVGMLTGRAELLAGPMAVTGWDEWAGARGESEVADLAEADAAGVEAMLARIVRDLGVPGSRVAEFARWAAVQPRPVMRLLTGDEALEYLTRREG